MDPVDPLRREMSPSGAPDRGWRVISIVFAIVSVILLVAALRARPQTLEVFSILLVVLTAALCVVIFLHARFLLQLHHEHRETWAEADALRKATLALTQDLRMDYVLDTLLQSLTELIPCECARVLLVEADSRLFVARERLRHDSGKKVSDYPMTLVQRIIHRSLEVQNTCPARAC